MLGNPFYIPITFYNPLKAYFWNKKYMYITIQTYPTQIVKVYFLMKRQVFSGVLKILVYKINYLSLFFYRFSV